MPDVYHEIKEAVDALRAMSATLDARLGPDASAMLRFHLEEVVLDWSRFSERMKEAAASPTKPEVLARAIEILRYSSLPHGASHLDAAAAILENAGVKTQTHKEEHDALGPSGGGHTHNS